MDCWSDGEMDSRKCISPSLQQFQSIEWMFIFWVGQVVLISGILFALLRNLIPRAVAINLSSALTIFPDYSSHQTKFHLRR